MAWVFPAATVLVVWLLAKVRQFFFRKRPNVTWGVFSYRENWTLSDSLFVVGALCVLLGTVLPSSNYPGDEWADKAMPRITTAMYEQERQDRAEKMVEEFLGLPRHALHNHWSGMYGLMNISPYLLTGDEASIPLQVTPDHAARIKKEAARLEGRTLFQQLRFGSYLLYGLLALGFLVWEGKKLILLGVVPFGLLTLDWYFLEKECAAFATRALELSPGQHPEYLAMDQVVLANTLDFVLFPGPAVYLFGVAGACMVLAATIRK